MAFNFELVVRQAAASQRDVAFSFYPSMEAIPAEFGKLGWIDRLEDGSVLEIVFGPRKEPTISSSW